MFIELLSPRISARTYCLHLIVFFCLFLAIKPVSAQNIPAGQEPAAQAERIQDETESKKESLQKEQKQPQPVEVPVTKEEPPLSAEGVSFTLKEVAVGGSTLFSPHEYNSIYKPYIGKVVGFKDLVVIADMIKALYKRKGFLTTTVYLPEQEVTAGRFEIKVLEGKTGKLTIEGNKSIPAFLIRKFVHARENELLNINKLQRDILRLNKNPDLDLKVVIASGSNPQESDITLKVQDSVFEHIGTSFDNQGSRLLGKYRPWLTLRSTNLTNHLDSLYVSTLYCGDTFGESVSYTLPIGTYGTVFGLDMGYFKMRLGKEYKPFHITGASQTYSPYLGWELYLDENFSADLDVGMEIKSSSKKMLGEVTANDQLRLPYFSFDFTRYDSLGGVTSFSPRFSFGTEDFLGASSRDHPTASRAGSGGFFFKYNQSLQRIQRMPWDTYLSLRSQLQAVSHTLPSSEQLQLGGANSIRGYPEGDYLCDMGGSLNMDLIMPSYLIPERWKLPFSSLSLRRQIEPVIFADAGGGKLKKVIPGEKENKFLASVGGGVRVHFNKNIYVRLEWAKYVADSPVSGSGPSTFHLTFQAEM